jgi:hypothetical protein
MDINHLDTLISNAVTCANYVLVVLGMNSIWDKFIEKNNGITGSNFVSYLIHCVGCLVLGVMVLLMLTAVCLRFS